jgi:hypothetical protein
MSLADLFPDSADPDTVFDAFSGWAAGQGSPCTRTRRRP